MGSLPFLSEARAEKEKRQCSGFRSRDQGLTSKTSRRSGLRSGLAKRGVRLEVQLELDLVKIRIYVLYWWILYS